MYFFFQLYHCFLVDEILERIIWKEAMVDSQIELGHFFNCMLESKKYSWFLFPFGKWFFLGASNNKMSESR